MYLFLFSPLTSYIVLGFFFFFNVITFSSVLTVDYLWLTDRRHYYGFLNHVGNNLSSYIRLFIHSSKYLLSVQVLLCVCARAWRWTAPRLLGPWRGRPMNSNCGGLMSFMSFLWPSGDRKHAFRHHHLCPQIKNVSTSKHPLLYFSLGCIIYKAFWHRRSHSVLILVCEVGVKMCLPQQRL